MVGAADCTVESPRIAPNTFGNLTLVPSDRGSGGGFGEWPKQVGDPIGCLMGGYAKCNRDLKPKVRKAMEGYLRDRLGLTMTDGKPPPRLLE